VDSFLGLPRHEIPAHSYRNDTGQIDGFLADHHSTHQPEAGPPRRPAANRKIGQSPGRQLHPVSSASAMLGDQRRGGRRTPGRPGCRGDAYSTGPRPPLGIYSGYSVPRTVIFGKCCGILRSTAYRGQPPWHRLTGPDSQPIRALWAGALGLGRPGHRSVNSSSPGPRSPLPARHLRRVVHRLSLPVLARAAFPAAHRQATSVTARIRHGLLAACNTCL